MQSRKSVTHHEPPTCPAFLLAQQLYADMRSVQLALAADRPYDALYEVNAAIRRAEQQAA